MNMELIFYDKKTLVPRGFHIASPAVSLGPSGKIRLSKELCRIMVLSPGNYVAACQSKTDSKDWYLCKTQSHAGWHLKEHKNGDVAFYAVALVKLIRQSLGIEDDKKWVTFLVSSKPEVTADHELYFIIPKAI
jgi:hypothetical protein